MKVLKGVALSILSFLLFLSLSAFGLAFAVNSTILNPDFMTSEVNRINMPALTRELADTLIIPQLPKELQFLKDPIYGAMSDFAPVLKQQLVAAVGTAHDYFLGKTKTLSLVISLEPLKTNLRDRARQALMQSLPPQLAGLPQAQIDQYFNQFYQQFSQQIPSSFTLNESSLDPQTLAHVKQARQYVGDFQLGYKLLIAFMALLVVGIILISRSVKQVTRNLGVNFLIYGVFEYAGILIAKQFAPGLPLPMVPEALQTWLSQVLVDSLTPLELFSAVLIAAGIILTVISFVYRPRQAEPVDASAHASDV